MSIPEATSEYAFGTDYQELNGMDIYRLTEEKYRELKAVVDSGKIVTYSCNGLVMPEYRLTGEDVSFSAIEEYSKMLFARLAGLNIRMLVFGSSKAKNVPEGFPMEKAWEQLFRIGTIFSDTAKQYGQTVAVEPLSYGEVNIVNTVEEAQYYAKSVNRDNFKVLADFYHVNHNQEDFETIRRCGKDLVHVHIASPTRTLPESEEDYAFFRKCLNFLKEIGYTSGVSFEGKKPAGDVGVREMVDFMREVIRA